MNDTNNATEDFAVHNDEAEARGEEERSFEEKRKKKDGP